MKKLDACSPDAEYGSPGAVDAFDFCLPDLFDAPTVPEACVNRAQPSPLNPSPTTSLRHLDVSEQLVPSRGAGGASPGRPASPGGVLDHVQGTVIPRIEAEGGDTQHMKLAMAILTDRHHLAPDHGATDLPPMLPAPLTAAALFEGFRVAPALEDALADGRAIAPHQIRDALEDARDEFAKLFEFCALSVNEMLRVQFMQAHELGRAAAKAEAEARTTTDSTTAKAGLDPLADFDLGGPADLGDNDVFGDNLDQFLGLDVDGVDGSELSSFYGLDGPASMEEQPKIKSEPMTPPPSAKGTVPRMTGAFHTAQAKMAPVTAGPKKAGKSRKTGTPMAAHRAMRQTVEAADARAPGIRRRQKHECPHCDKCLDTKYKLERHVRTHTGEKPFECQVCHARFNQKSSLKTHSTIHAKAALSDPKATKESIANYCINGHTFEDLGIPYATFVFDAILKQRRA